VDLARPNAWLQPTTAREAHGKEVMLPRFKKHLLCDKDGLFPESFNSSWEDKVVLTELQRPGNIAWYRNPARASQDSLGVTYDDGGEVKIVRPDFVFFTQGDDGIAVDIVDPHGIQFADALPKLRGLARYAERHPGVYRRIEVVAQVGTKFRTIDLTESRTRVAVLAAENVKELYDSEAAVDYLI
jgi:hypothetical protein